MTLESFQNPEERNPSLPNLSLKNSLSVEINLSNNELNYGVFRDFTLGKNKLINETINEYTDILSILDNYSVSTPDQQKTGGWKEKIGQKFGDFKKVTGLNNILKFTRRGIQTVGQVAQNSINDVRKGIVGSATVNAFGGSEKVVKSGFGYRAFYADTVEHIGKSVGGLEGKINSQIQQKWSNISPEDQKIIQDKIAKIAKTTSDFRQNITNTDSQGKTVTNYYGAEEEKLQTKGRLTTTGAITLASAAFGPLGYAAIAARTLVNASIGEVKGLSEQTLKSQRENLEKELVLEDLQNISLLLDNLGDQKISLATAEVIRENFKKLNNKFLLTGQMEAEYLKIEAKLSPDLHPENFVSEGQEIPENSKLANNLLSEFSNKLDATTAKVLGQEFIKTVESEFNDPKKKLMRIGMVVGASVAGLAFSAYIGRPVLQGLYKTIFQHGETVTLPTKSGTIRLQSSHAPLAGGDKILSQQGDLLVVGDKDKFPNGQLPTDGEIATALDNHFKNAPTIEGAKVSDFKTPDGRILEGVRMVDGKIDGKTGILITDQNNTWVSYDDTEIRFDKGTSGSGLDFEKYQDQTVIGKYGDQLVIADRNAPKSSIEALNSIKGIEKYATLTNQSLPTTSEFVQPTVAIPFGTSLDPNQNPSAVFLPNQEPLKLNTLNNPDDLTRLQNALGNNAATNTPLPGSDLAIRDGLTGRDGVINPEDIPNAKLKIGVELNNLRTQLSNSFDPTKAPDPDFNRIGVQAKIAQLTKLQQEINNLKPGQAIRLNDDLSSSVVDQNGTIQLDSKITNKIKQITDPKKFGLDDNVISKAEGSEKLGEIQEQIKNSVDELKKLKTDNPNNTELAKIADQRIAELENLGKAIPKNDQVTITQGADGKLSFKGDNVADNSDANGSNTGTLQPVVDQSAVPKPSLEANTINGFGPEVQKAIEAKLDKTIEEGELDQLRDILIGFAKRNPNDEIDTQDVREVMDSLVKYFRDGGTKVRIEGTTSQGISFFPADDNGGGVIASFTSEPDPVTGIANPNSNSIAGKFNTQILNDPELSKILKNELQQDEVDIFIKRLRVLAGNDKTKLAAIADAEKELKEYFFKIPGNSGKSVIFDGIEDDNDGNVATILLEADGKPLNQFPTNSTTSTPVPTQTVTGNDTINPNSPSFRQGSFPNSIDPSRATPVLPDNAQQPIAASGSSNNTLEPGSIPDTTGQPRPTPATSTQTEYVGSNTTDFGKIYSPDSQRGGITDIFRLTSVSADQPIDPQIKIALDEYRRVNPSFSLRDFRSVAEITGLYKLPDGRYFTGDQLRNALQLGNISINNPAQIQAFLDQSKIEPVGGMGIGAFNGNLPTIEQVKMWQTESDKLISEYAVDYDPANPTVVKFRSLEAEASYRIKLMELRESYIRFLGRQDKQWRSDNDSVVWAGKVYDRGNGPMDPVEQRSAVLSRGLNNSEANSRGNLGLVTRQGSQGQTSSQQIPTPTGSNITNGATLNNGAGVNSTSEATNTEATNNNSSPSNFRLGSANPLTTDIVTSDKINSQGLHNLNANIFTNDDGRVTDSRFWKIPGTGEVREAVVLPNPYGPDGSVREGGITGNQDFMNEWLNGINDETTYYDPENPGYSLIVDKEGNSNLQVGEGAKPPKEGNLKFRVLTTDKDNSKGEIKENLVIVKSKDVNPTTNPNNGTDSGNIQPQANNTSDSNTPKGNGEPSNNNSQPEAKNFNVAQIGDPERGDVTTARTAFNSDGTIDGLDVNKDMPKSGNIGLPWPLGERHIPLPDANVFNKSVLEMNEYDYYNRWRSLLDVNKGTELGNYFQEVNKQVAGMPYGTQLKMFKEVDGLLENIAKVDTTNKEKAQESVTKLLEKYLQNTDTILKNPEQEKAFFETTIGILTAGVLAVGGGYVQGRYLYNPVNDRPRPDVYDPHTGARIVNGSTDAAGNTRLSAWKDRAIMGVGATGGIGLVALGSLLSIPLAGTLGVSAISGAVGTAVARYYRNRVNPNDANYFSLY